MYVLGPKIIIAKGLVKIVPALATLFCPTVPGSILLVYILQTLFPGPEVSLPAGFSVTYVSNQSCRRVSCAIVQGTYSPIPCFIRLVISESSKKISKQVEFRCRYGSCLVFVFVCALKAMSKLPVDPSSISICAQADFSVSSTDYEK